MTFICQLDLYPLKMYLHTKNELPMAKAFESESIVDTHKDATKRINYCVLAQLHLRVVMTILTAGRFESSGIG